MKKILLVGQNGYIGSAFERYMSTFSEYSVSSVSSLNYEWQKCDFSDYDAVYNVSGLAHANARQASEKEYYNVNGVLPVKIAEKAKKEAVPLFVHMSSMIIYGDMSELGKAKIIDETTVPDAEGVYGKSKIMSEKGLMELADSKFKVALIRPPLIYGEDAQDNFRRLVKFAVSSPVFPDIKNKQSMLYIDNLCELVRLIIDESCGGIFYPQQEKYIVTSQLVRDIAGKAGHSIFITKAFNPILKLLSNKMAFVRKAFGNLTYDMSISNHFEGKYRIVNYEDSVKRIAERMKI